MSLSLPDDIEIKLLPWSGMYQVRVKALWAQAVTQDIPTLVDNVIVVFKDGIPHVFSLGDEITLFIRS